MKRFIFLSLLGAAALSASADYAINFPEGTKQTATSPARTIQAVTFESGTLPAQTLTVGQESGGDLYVDCTNKAFIFLPGKTVSVAYTTEGNWMNTYLWIDWGNDGAFDIKTDADGNIEDPQDLVSYSHYNGVNSAGEEAKDPNRNGAIGNTTLLPDFVATSKPGTYRARFIHDYNGINPGGSVGVNPSDKKTFTERGGGIADAYIVVTEPFSGVNQLDITSDHGAIQASYNELDGTVTLVCTEDEGYYLVNVEVTNKFNLPEGVELADKIVGAASRYSAESGMATIPASALVPGASIVAKFKSEAEIGGTKEYPTTLSGEKANNEGILSITLNDTMLGVNAKTRHCFIDKALNVLKGQPLRLSCAYTGPAKSFSLYIDTDQKGEFGSAVAKAETLAKMGEIKLPASITTGIYRARVQAEGDCEVDFLINVHNSTVAYRPFALNGIILDGSENPMLETYPALQPIAMTVKPSLPGFSTDFIIVRHGQNIYGDEFIAGNRQWADEQLDLDADGKVVIPSDLVNGDLAVYALYNEEENSEWTKIWGDEFSGKTMDSNRWITQGWRGSAWNRFISLTAAGHKVVNKFDDGYYNSYCIKTPEDIAQAEGNLQMISGALTSMGKFSMTYGYIECRAKTRKHTGNFPAFWMMPTGTTLVPGPDSPKNLTSWPNNGEIDIWESINTQDAAHSTIHSGWTGWKSYDGWPVAPKQASPTSTKQTWANMDLFHVFALEWDEDGLYFYLDGKKVFTYPNKHYSEPDSPYYLPDVCWPFNKPFYVIVNQSVGNGNWAANPDVNFEYLTEFDYVRAYQKKGGKYTSAIKGNGDDPDFYAPATNDPFADSGIEDVRIADTFDEEAPVVIYDLAGRRVANPSTGGIYIMQQGSKSQKIVIR